jgi:hypothetical protein
MRTDDINGTMSFVVHTNRTNVTQVSSAYEYYHIHMLGINRSTGLTDLGSIKVDLLLCLITVFAVMYICVYRGVKGTGE